MHVIAGKIDYASVVIIQCTSRYNAIIANFDIALHLNTLNISTA